MANLFNPGPSKDAVEASSGLAELAAQMDTLVGRLKVSGDELSTAVKGVVGSLARTVADTTFARNLAELAGPLNAVANLLNGFTASLQTATTQLASGFLRAIQAPLGPFTALAQVLGPFVAAFNPATMEAFQLALRDLAAVFGQGLQPVMVAVTGAVRIFADELLNSGLPEILGEILLTIVEAAKPILPVFIQLAKVFAPISQLLGGVLAEALKVFAGALKGLLDAVYFVQQAMYDVYRTLLNLIPDGGPKIEARDFEIERRVDRESKERLSAVGLGVRNVSISTGGDSLESLRRNVATNALKIGGGETAIDIAKSSRDRLDKQIEILTQIRDKEGSTAAIENMLGKLLFLRSGTDVVTGGAEAFLRSTREQGVR